MPVQGIQFNFMDQAMPVAVQNQALYYPFVDKSAVGQGLNIC